MSATYWYIQCTTKAAPRTPAAVALGGMISYSHFRKYSSMPSTHACRDNLSTSTRRFQRDKITRAVLRVPRDIACVRSWCCKERHGYSWCTSSSRVTERKGFAVIILMAHMFLSCRLHSLPAWPPCQQEDQMTCSRIAHRPQNGSWVSIKYASHTGVGVKFGYLKQHLRNSIPATRYIIYSTSSLLLFLWLL